MTNVTIKMRVSEIDKTARLLLKRNPMTKELESLIMQIEWLQNALEQK